ncbi:MAG TPA: DnaB-like helicase N-terminal domain-containing protein, partial [Ignavibacteriales bacterium]|nr:DnaB-like helicase N-terminal domain-containing protein [Ignavibacteriales bacterium]
MTAKERNTFEQTVISSILKSKELFMEVFNFCHNNEAFMIRENRQLFDYAVEYFYEYGKEPGLRTLNQHLVSKENGGRLKEYLKDHIVNAEYALNPVDYVRRLLDDNINHEINDAVKTTGGPGFDRAIALNESIGG